MKWFLFLLIHALGTRSYSQFAIISDKDGYVNVRNDAHANSNTVDSLQNGHLVYCFENRGNWTNIDYARGSKELNGYIYKDRYKPVSGFEQIPLHVSQPHAVSFKKDSIEIILTESPFVKKKHKLTYYKEYPDQIEFIDNKRYWGKDGGMPTRQFEQVIIKTGKNKYTLPKNAFEGLYEPTLYSAEVFIDTQDNTLYIQSLNSDAAGSYEVIWKIKDGVYTGRLVVHGF